MPMKCPGIAVACIALQLLLCYSEQTGSRVELSVPSRSLVKPAQPAACPLVLNLLQYISALWRYRPPLPTLSGPPSRFGPPCKF